MTYEKIVKMIPAEKREKVSETLIDIILKSKKDEKMPSGLANTILYHWQRGVLESDLGLEALFEAALLLETDKTIEKMKQELQSTEVEKLLRRP